MDIVQKRDFIHSHLHQVNAEFIDEVFLNINKIVSGNDMVVGYRVDGSEITREDLMNRANVAEDDIAAGRYKSQDDLEREFEDIS